MIALRLVAALSLTILPGAWLVFSRPGGWLPFGARIAVAGALSPVVVAAEFYFLRLTGVPVGLTAWLIVALNLPAAWLIRRQWSSGTAERGSIIEWSFVFALLIAAVSIPWLVVEQLRIYYGHTWLHSAIISQFLNGSLVPEEPELAGVRLAYPWLSHIYWATLGKVLDWAPTRVFAFTDLVWIVWTTVLVYSASRLLGARAFAARASVLFLTLGTNVVGAILWWATGDLPGDIRYTPWLRKFMVFNDMPFALALFGALVVLAIAAIKRTDGRHAALTGVVLLGVGLTYPPILPAALGVAALVLLLRRRDAMAYGGAFVAACAISAVVLQFTIASRATGAVALSSLEAAFTKLASAAIVLAISGAATVIVLVRRERSRRVDAALVLLVVSALGAVVAGAAFNLNGDTFNEYKLMFCAALLLAPFTALALDRLTPASLSPTLVVMLVGLLLAPMVLMVNPRFGFSRVAKAPAVAEEGVNVRLVAGSAESGWTDAIREQTPPDTIIVAWTSEVFIPGTTARSLFAPVVGVGFPGYWLESRHHMVDLRGYSTELVTARLQTLEQLQTSTVDAGDMWAKVAILGRPIAVVASRPQQAAMLDWLASRGAGRQLFTDASGRVVWFCPREQLPILMPR